jgi:phosphoglycerate dehydrogenase-like enzyme
MPTNRRVMVAIATPLEAELVHTIRAVDDRLEVQYQPDLLPPPRYPCDHRGLDSYTRTTEQRHRWSTMLSEAEVLFGFPGGSAEGLREVVRANPGLRWVQATAGGAGEQVRAAGLTDDELTRVMITRAGGVHAGPLAEFAMLGVLAFAKGLPRLLADTVARRWGHYPMAELSGQTLLVIGLGPIGAEVARLGAAFGMRVIGVNRTGTTEVRDVDEVHPVKSLVDVLPNVHAVVLTLPLTEQTRHLIDAAVFDRMRAGAVFVNVGRGGVVDEPALIAALADGRLSGAALDVFATEPLPPQSPLWDMSNVLISPHTAALSVRENERIVAVFTENLRRYVDGHELISRV